LGLIAGVNLSVNAKAATLGRQIQYEHKRIQNLENKIADKESLLAALTSAEVMERRAQEMGFRRATSDEIMYLVVDGYKGRRPAVLASENKAFVPVSNSTLSPAFTQSLFDWIFEKVSLPVMSIGKELP
jgi:hypothetical protein